MPAWSSPALAGAVFIAVHFLLLRAASGRLEDRLGALVLETTAALGVAASLLFGLRAGPLAATRTGVAFAAGSGLAVSVASVLLFAALRKGGPVASTGTIVLGGGVALSALAAPLIFGEAFTVRRAAGVALGLAAMWVLGAES
jgi:hypothetical protein